MKQFFFKWLIKPLLKHAFERGFVHGLTYDFDFMKDEQICNHYKKLSFDAYLNDSWKEYQTLQKSNK